MRLGGRVAVVTGGAMGIGKGIAEALVREGARVAIADVNEEVGAETEKELAELGEVMLIGCDVSVERDVADMVEGAVQRFGALHVLVNNAAVGIYRSVDQATTEEFDRCLAVNLRGPFLCTRYAVPPIRASGGGSIINVASVHSVQNVGGTAPYAASKGGLAALTRASAIDLSPEIRVNAICPGWIDTPLIRGVFDAGPEGMRSEVERRQLLKRLGTPEDIGRAVVFLASDESAYVTGSLLFVDSGMTAQLETW
jgi:NAD(P)-dependent dehydrogenase (short-subunit alcohol dehydrogenase family)